MAGFLTDAALTACDSFLELTSHFRPATRAVRKTIAVDRLNRQYLVFTPRVLPPFSPVAVVLHAGGGSARRMERRTRFNALAAQQGFVVVYPESIGGNWNDGRGCSAIRAQRENIDDVTFVRRILDEVASQHSIDRRRVFVTGASNGAMLAHRLAAEASDIICAIAPVVGGMAPAIATNFCPEFPVSILIIQGAADPIVPIAGGSIVVDRFERRGEVISTHDVVTRYCSRNGNSGEAERTILDVDPHDATSLEMVRYHDGIGGTKTSLYLIKGGGHAWPGPPLNRLDRKLNLASQDISATDVIWDFFKSCPSR
jgi:polyhydroxybutyrate depolymerase